MSAPDDNDERDALSPDDEAMNAWLDRQLGKPDAAKTGDLDAAQAAEAKTLAQMLATLRDMPQETAPKELLEDVQSDIRQRSGGRYYGYHWKYRFPWETLLTTMLLIIAVVVYVLSRPPVQKLIPIDAKTFLVSGSDLGVGARILSDYGSFERDPDAAIGGDWMHLVGHVPATRIDALRSELSLYPSMRIDAEEPAGERIKVWVAIKK